MSWQVTLALSQRANSDEAADASYRAKNINNVTFVYLYVTATIVMYILQR